MNAFVILLGITVTLLIGLTVLIVILTQQTHRKKTKPKTQDEGEGLSVASTDELADD